MSKGRWNGCTGLSGAMPYMGARLIVAGMDVNDDADEVAVDELVGESDLMDIVKLNSARQD